MRRTLSEIQRGARVTSSAWRDLNAICGCRGTPAVEPRHSVGGVAGRAPACELELARQGRPRQAGSNRVGLHHGRCVVRSRAAFLSASCAGKLALLAGVDGDGASLRNHPRCRLSDRRFESCVSAHARHGAAPGRARKHALVGEHLSRTVWAGVAILSSAIFFLVFDARARHHSGPATALAVLNAFIIATYTVIDGMGSRKSGDPVAYSLWLSLFIAVPWVGVACLGHRAQRADRCAPSFCRGLWEGPARSHRIRLALWAMTRAPIAAVAAVRETSIVFGTLLGALVLRERVTWVRASRWPPLRRVSG